MQQPFPEQLYKIFEQKRLFFYSVIKQKHFDEFGQLERKSLQTFRTIFNFFGTLQ